MDYNALLNVQIHHLRQDILTRLYFKISALQSSGKQHTS